jgi:nucleoside-triphosphatase THEP1
MGKTEFRIKRFGEKLRVILAKGGELIRSLSTRSRNKKSAREHDEWLSDSLYSGV